jgi:hypothetical protein
MTSEVIEAIEVGSELVDYAPARNLFGTSEPTEVLLAAKRVASALKAEIVAADMVRKIGGREYVLAEGWGTLGAMLGVTPHIVWSRSFEDGWEARAEVITADGRVIGAGEAMCLRSERGWAGRDSYALRSMAQTRATSRALRSVLAFVMTLSGVEATPAEEISDVPAEPVQIMPEWAQPADPVAASQALTQLLKVMEVAEPAQSTITIGQKVFETCSNTFPRVAQLLVEELLRAVSSQ